MAGSLRIVGIGMCLPDHLTVEAHQAIEAADCIFAVTDDVEKLEWLRGFRGELTILNSYYLPGQERLQTYQNMADSVLQAVEAGQTVAMVSYGHPGVYCIPAHKALAACRERGLDVAMLPGISAMDCLYADLGLDPLSHGVQAYEGNDCLVYQRNWQGRPLRFLWQPNFIGVFDTPTSQQPPRPLLRILQEQLIEVYGPGHPWVVYQAAVRPGLAHKVDCFPLSELLDREMLAYSTVLLPHRDDWVPPSGEGLKIVGLGRDAERQTTQATLRLLEEASEPRYQGLSPEQEQWLLGRRPDARPYADDGDLLVLAGHPAFHGGGALAAARPARLYPALAPDDYEYCELGFGPEDSGFQVVATSAKPEWLDLHATVLLLNGASWSEPDAFQACGRCLFPAQKPQPNPPLLQKLTRATALPRLVACIHSLAPEQRNTWKTAAMLATLEDASEETQLLRVLELTGKLAQEQLFEESLKSGIDLSRPETISAALERHPNSPFARWVQLRVEAATARQGFEDGFRDGGELLALTDVGQ